MRIISILLLLMTLALFPSRPAMADAGKATRVEVIDGYTVMLSFAEGEAHLGHNELHIEIHDPRGKDVSGSEVTIVARLFQETAESTAAETDGMEGHSMGTSGNTGHPSSIAPVKTVTIKAEAGHEIGEYTGEIELEEAGHWMIEVIFMADSLEKLAEFSVEVSATPNGWRIVLPFLGFISGVIIIAAITRKRLPAADSSAPKEAK